MRLTTRQIQTILATTRHALGAEASIRLFGSRVDDAAKGGDIDLFIETRNRPDIWRKAQLLAELEKHLGLPVDIVLHAATEPETPLQRIAKQTGVILS